MSVVVATVWRHYVKYEETYGSVREAWEELWPEQEDGHCSLAGLTVNGEPRSWRDYAQIYDPDWKPPKPYVPPPEVRLRVAVLDPNDRAGVMRLAFCPRCAEKVDEVEPRYFDPDPFDMGLGILEYFPSRIAGIELKPCGDVVDGMDWAVVPEGAHIVWYSLAFAAGGLDLFK